jgi:hypothetical protein
MPGAAFIPPLLVPGETTWAEGSLSADLTDAVAVSNTSTCPA